MIKRLSYKPLDLEKELITCAKDGDKEGLLSTFRLIQRINKSDSLKMFDNYKPYSGDNPTHKTTDEEEIRRIINKHNLDDEGQQELMKALKELEAIGYDVDEKVYKELQNNND